MAWTSRDRRQQPALCYETAGVLRTLQMIHEVLV